MTPTPTPIAEAAAAAVPIQNTLINAAIIAALVLFVVWVVLRNRPGWVGLSDDEGPALRATAMAAEITKLTGQNQLMLGQLVIYEAKSQASEARFRESELKVIALTAELAVLRQQLEAKKVIDPLPTDNQICVLGVWPKAPGLDPAANKEALAMAGVTYTELSDERATMEAITYALPLRPYTMLEVGARGNAKGIELGDGIAPHQWWVDLAREYPQVKIFLFLSDFSGAQGQTSIADRVFAAPSVSAVISVDGVVEEPVARRFARRLYARLGEGQSIGVAMRTAQLAVGVYGQLFRLRVKQDVAAD